MVNPELVRQLLKELEAEKECPVQLRIDTPISARYSSCKEYFGEFSKRGVIVNRVKKLDLKYERDIKLIEGEHESLAHLERRLQELNAIHGNPHGNNLADKAYKLVKETTRKEVLAPLSGNFREWGPPFIQFSAEKLYSILDTAGMVYLRYNLVAQAKGIYDDRTSYGGLGIVDETKVADITLKLIE